MGVRLQLILTAFIVDSILISSNRGQSTAISNIDAGEIKNSGSPSVESGVRRNFQNLVNSVATSDTRRSEIYRHILKRDVVEERQSFDAVKERMEAARSRNGAKKGSPLNDENVVLAKREIKLSESDEAFIAKYGSQLNNSGIWEELRKEHEDFLWTENLCDQAHKSAKKRPGKIGLAIPYSRTLRFSDSERYPPIEIDVVVYIIYGYNTLEGMPYFFYITKGLRSDCVFYLIPEDSEGSSLKLGEHVCGIKM